MGNPSSPLCFDLLRQVIKWITSWFLYLLHLTLFISTLYQLLDKTVSWYMCGLVARYGSYPTSLSERLMIISGFAAQWNFNAHNEQHLHMHKTLGSRWNVSCDSMFMRHAVPVRRVRKVSCSERRRLSPYVWSLLSQSKWTKLSYQTLISRRETATSDRGQNQTPEKITNYFIVLPHRAFVDGLVVWML